MKCIYIIAIIGLFSFSLSAQVNTGLVMEDDQNTPVISDFTGKKFNENAMKVKVDLRRFAPQPQDQGELPSCVGWSVGYAALTIMAAREQAWVNTNFITDQAFSPLFIYNQLVQDKNCMYAGASFPSAFQLLKEEGVCKKQTFNIDNEECSVLPGANQKQQAKENKIKDYYQLFMKNASEETKVRKIRRSLAEGYPVVVGMFLTPNFRDFTKEKVFWKPQDVERDQLYPHAMVVVGYNDIQKSFELMNSWGSDWGDGGFVKVKYKDFAKHCVLGYQLHLPENGEILADEEKKPRDPFEPFVNKEDNVKHKAGRKKTRPEKLDLHGDFVFRYPTDMIGDEVVFEEAEVELVDNHYSLVKKDWELGQLFQLVAKNIKKNRYVYVFSIDGNQNANLHWPKMRLMASDDAEDDRKQKFGYTESPLVPYDAAEIAIPGEKTALQKQIAGNDYLFVLYSYNLLDNIETIIEDIRSSGLPMEKRLEAVLGDELIPYNEVQFDKSKISAKTNAANGTILGVMIESKGE